MQLEIPKAVKRELRELAGKAYEVELSAHLKKLSRHFDAWKSGAIDCWDLQERIHNFHNGPARKLLSLYDGRDPHFEVARGITHRFLDKADVSAAAWPYVAPLLPMYEHEDDYGDEDESEAEPRR
ncbi:MAG: hypothetical protein ACLQVD_00475 [Capsulimonadaceae bacterium]